MPFKFTLLQETILAKRSALGLSLIASYALATRSSSTADSEGRRLGGHYAAQCHLRSLILVPIENRMRLLLANTN